MVPIEGVGRVGVEPTRAFAQKILSLQCLPFHHRPTKICAMGPVPFRGPGASRVLLSHEDSHTRLGVGSGHNTDTQYRLPVPAQW